MQARTPTTPTTGGINPQSARRLIAVFAGAVVFLGVASLIKPEPRSATANPVDRAPAALGNAASRPGALDTPESDVARRLGRIAHPKGWKLLGQLESREYHVLMFTSPDGPRYSIYSLQGELLMPDMAGDEVYRLFPSLDLSTLHDIPADGSKAIMLAEPVQ